MKSLWVAVLVVAAVGQEVKHAPTVEQCRADQKLWMAKLEGENGLKYVSYKELRGWRSVMNDCEDVDSDLRDRYDHTGSEILAAKAMRLEDFIDRHGMWEKFIAEDEQGKGR